MGSKRTAGTVRARSVCCLVYHKQEMTKPNEIGQAHDRPAPSPFPLEQPARALHVPTCVSTALAYLSR